MRTAVERHRRDTAARRPATPLAHGMPVPNLVDALARAPLGQRRSAAGALGSRVGNHQLALTIGSGLTVQRETTVGPMQQAQVGGFVGDVVTFWRANPAMDELKKKGP